jgi:hypothetical protein
MASRCTCAAAGASGGFLHPSSQTYNPQLISAFRDGLKESGYVGGKNVAIEYRWGDDEVDRLPPLAADLVLFHDARTPCHTRDASNTTAATEFQNREFSGEGERLRQKAPHPRTTCRNNSE